MVQQAQDVIDTVHAGPLPSPLPGGMAAVSRYLLNQPTWLQISAAVVLAVVAAFAALLLWKRRAAIRMWITTRSRGAKIGLATVAGVVLAGFVALGVYGWNFTMHNNDFCVSCHVMSPAFSRFQHSEHKQLQCHDCHQQSLYASARQLVLWVLEKPQVIPMHKRVPNRVCGECHLQKEGADSVWKRISATAGHRLHLHSDSAPLKNVQCVTCHGKEVHHFVPVDSTCGQSQCHQKTQFHLGKMAQQTQLHCVQCHQFTERVSETISTDSAKKVLVPDIEQCFGCHEMKQKMANYEPAKDPHQAVCGACHDPHKDKVPADAWTRCTNCHVRPDTMRFHRALSVASVGKCANCHKAHTWTLSSGQCAACHQNVLRDEPAPRTTSAGVTPAVLASLKLPASTYAATGKFSHKRHRDVECTSCHATGKDHGKLLLTGVVDCQSCHHASPTKSAAGTPPVNCATCHTSTELSSAYPDTLSIRLTVWQSPRNRVLAFRHANHTAVACGGCHTTPLTLARAPDATCSSCHTQHHDPAAECRTCHLPSKNAHTREAHLGCSGSQCHAPQAVQQLQPKRNTCLVCHQDRVDHQPGKECATCHQVQWLSQQKSGP